MRTHYPATRELELAVMRQEAKLPRAEGITVHMPAFMEAILGELTLQGRASPDVNQSSGVSVRMSIANYETLAANAIRRALKLGEAHAVPRITDLEAIVQSTAGKLELEYAGEERSETEIVRGLVQRAVRLVFDAAVPLEGVASVVESFNQGWKVEIASDMPAGDYLDGLEEIRGLREAAAQLAGGDTPEHLAAAIEFILEGLHLANRLNRTATESGARYGAS